MGKAFEARVEAGRQDCDSHGGALDSLPPNRRHEARGCAAARGCYFDSVALSRRGPGRMTRREPRDVAVAVRGRRPIAVRVSVGYGH